MMLFGAMQADHCERLPDGSEVFPFTQTYLNECMRQRRVRPEMYGHKTAVECLKTFKVAQERKILRGIGIQCSQSLGTEFRREALMGDFGM